MRIIFIAMSLLLGATSSACAGGGVARVGTEILEMARTFTRRAHSLPRADLGKRFASTQGYRPTKPVELVFQSDTMTNQKVIFLDAGHERFVRLNQSVKASKERDMASTERKDDHTLIVNLKKK